MTKSEALENLEANLDDIVAFLLKMQTEKASAEIDAVIAEIGALQFTISSGIKVEPEVILKLAENKGRDVAQKLVAEKLHKASEVQRNLKTAKEKLEKIYAKHSQFAKIAFRWSSVMLVTF
jgi:hypothetical protein